MQLAKANPSDVTHVSSPQQENRETEEIPKLLTQLWVIFFKAICPVFFSNQNYVKTWVCVLDPLGLAT